MTVACGECGSDLAGEPGFSSWCPACDWNVRPKSGNEWRQAVVAPGSRRSKATERIYRQVLDSAPVRPPRSAQGAVLLALACCVILWHIALMACSIWLVIASTSKVFTLLIAIPLFAAGAFPFLSLSRDRRHREAARREDFRELWAHIDDVSAAMKAPTVRKVWLDADFNASVRRGLRGSELTLGLPLWTALNSQQRTAVLAHEIAHLRNGDPARGVVVALAMTSLSEWYATLRSARGGFAAIFALVLSWPIGLTLSLMGRLSLLGSQRSEYFADLVGARVVSSEGLVSALAVLHSGAPTVQLALQQRGSDATPWDRIHSRFEALPSSEVRRRQRAAELDLAPDPDGTHPPMGWRIAVLRAHPQSGDIALSHAAVRQDPAFVEVGRKLHDVMVNGRSRRRRNG